MRKSIWTAAGCLAALGLQSATYYPVTVNYTPEEDIEDFPALLRIPAGSPIYASAGTNGESLRFTDELGVNDIPHEVDTWNTSGESLVWVKLPKLQNGATVRLYCDDLDSTSAAGVWSDYAGVWHLNEALDSSGKDLSPADPTVHTTKIYGDQVASAKIGMGYGRNQAGVGATFTSQVYDDRNGHKCPIQVSEPSIFTVSCWVKVVDQSTAWKDFFGPVSANNGQTGWKAEFTAANAASVRMCEWGVNGESLHYFTTTGLFSGWTKVDAVWNIKSMELFVNGVSLGRYDMPREPTWYWTGWMGWGGCIDANGSLASASSSSGVQFDECRIFDGAKSAVRIVADYDTVTVDDFLVIGSAQEEQTIPAGTVAQVGAGYYLDMASAVSEAKHSGAPVVLLANDLSWTFTTLGETVSFKIGSCSFEAINGLGEGYYLAETTDSSTGVTTYELKKQVVVAAMRNVAVYKSLETRDLLGLLPAQVAGLAADGSIVGMYDVVWNIRDISDYDYFGVTPISGTAMVGGEQHPVTAFVRATIPYSDDYHNIAPEASSMTIIAPAKGGCEAITEISRIQSGGNPSLVTNGLDAVVVTGGVWCANSTASFTNHQSAEAGNPYLDVDFTWPEIQNIHRIEVICNGGDNGCSPKTIAFSANGVSLSPAFHGENVPDRPKINNAYNRCYDFPTPVSSDNLKVSFEQLERTPRGNAGRITIFEILIWGDGGLVDKREMSTSAELTTLEFDGKPVDLIPGVTGYLADSPQAVTAASGEPNVAVTVLPEFERAIRIVTMGEDGSTLTYRISTQKTTVIFLK